MEEGFIAFVSEVKDVDLAHDVSRVGIFEFIDKIMTKGFRRVG